MNRKSRKFIRLSMATVLFAASALFVIFSFQFPSESSAKSVSADVSDLEQAYVDGLSGGAQSCILLDAYTGEILYRHNIDERLPMASTTKIMTALIALERGKLDEAYTIPASACGIEGSSLYLAAGEVFTLRELLYGLMLESGNDAAEAIALCVGGTKEAFVAAMNEKAAELGLSDTHFDNPHGLSSETHFTTARELAHLTAYALENADFRQIVSTKRYTIEATEKHAARYFINHNRLLGSFPSCIGVKTGYTLASGRCLVTASEHDGGRYVVVTLNDRDDFADHRVLLTYAEEAFKTYRAAEVGELSFEVAPSIFSERSIRLFNEKPLCVSVPREQTVGTEMTVSIDRAALKDGDPNAATVTVRAGSYACVYTLSVE